MTDENNGNDEHRRTWIDDIGNGVRYIQRKVVDIDARTDDHYHMLREILDHVSGENGASMFDLYDPEDEYE